MSIPKIDPNFTINELRIAGTLLLEAAYKYWEACAKSGISGSVVWLTDTNGKMVIFTRGEYRETLMKNIDSVGQQAIHFGFVPDDQNEGH